jgi:hypothetical protein
MIPESDQTKETTPKGQQDDFPWLGSTAWRLAEGCVLARVNDEAVLLTPSMVYLKLDQMGEYIVRSLLENCRGEQILQTIVNEYNVDKIQVKKDILEFIEDLKRHGVID